MFGISREGEVGGLLSCTPFPAIMYGDGRCLLSVFLSFETRGKSVDRRFWPILGIRRSYMIFSPPSFLPSFLPFLLFLTSQWMSRWYSYVGGKEHRKRGGREGEFWVGCWKTHNERRSRKDREIDEKRRYHLILQPIRKFTQTPFALLLGSPKREGGS